MALSSQYADNTIVVQNTIGNITGIMGNRRSEAP